MEYNEFGKTGALVSKLGLGGAPLAGDFGKTDEKEVQRMIHAAIDYGINFIDTAPLYGRGESERRIGRALADGKRLSVFLASKAVRSDLQYSYDAVIHSVEDSLRRLNTDWLDMLQMHDIETQPYELLMQETIPALKRLQSEGKIRFLGATTRHLHLLLRIMEENVLDSIQFYGRYMLLDFTAADEVIPVAKSKGIGIINGSVLGMGLLAGRPAAFLDPSVISMAEERLKSLEFLRISGQETLAEPAMRFSLGNPNIHVTLTGTSSLSTLASNVALCDGKGLPEEQLRFFMKNFAGSSFFP